MWAPPSACLSQRNASESGAQSADVFDFPGTGLGSCQTRQRTPILCLPGRPQPGTTQDWFALDSASALVACGSLLAPEAGSFQRVLQVRHGLRLAALARDRIRTRV